MPIMPRKAIPQSNDVADAIAKIQRHCRQSDTSILALAKASGVSQSALARFVDGERKTVTETARKALAYLDSRHKQHYWHNDGRIAAEAGSDLGGYRLIDDAARFLWDGKPQTAELVASLIRALKPAVEMATGRGGSGER